MKHLDLFSGVGGFSLACQWAGIETIGFVEIDKYCQKVLRKHWSDVPIVEDIRDVEKIKEIVANATKSRGWSLQGQRGQQEAIGYQGNSGIQCSTKGGFDSESPTLLITAGFPCQPFSVAGKQRSKEDDRYLWPETLAVIKAVKPKWVLLENVTGIINLALDQVLSDLEGAGYAWETLIIPACAVNAWHRRDRIWLVANSNSNGFSRYTKATQIQPKWRATTTFMPSSEDVADTNREGLQRLLNATREQGQESRNEQPIGCGGIPDESQWAVEPELGRVAHGIPHRVDRLKCLGNAIVPQVAFQLIKTIVEVENG